jgi:hypothetical protein
MQNAQHVNQGQLHTRGEAVFTGLHAVSNASITVCYINRLP